MRRKELHRIKSKNSFFLSAVIISLDRTSADRARATAQRDRPNRAKTRDEIYAFYCAFGEKQHPGQDFLSKILNILRDSIEGLLSHSEVKQYKKNSIS